MKKIFTMMLCLAGMLMGMTSARAASYVFNSTGNTNTTGNWRVTYDTLDWKAWNVTVEPGTAQPKFATSPGPAFGYAKFLEFSILDSFGQAPVASVANNGKVAASASLWGPSSPTGDVAVWATNATGNRLEGNNSNGKFTGSFTLSQAVYGGTFQFRGTGSTTAQSWIGSSSFLTPEMPGGVLLLAALLPLGLMLRKKGAFQKNAV